jgi:hypothetical protein
MIAEEFWIYEPVPEANLTNAFKEFAMSDFMNL